jgi:hypothetical protein
MPDVTLIDAKVVVVVVSKVIRDIIQVLREVSLGITPRFHIDFIQCAFAFNNSLTQPERFESFVVLLYVKSDQAFAEQYAIHVL